MPVAIDFDDRRRAHFFGDHDAPVAERLKGVYLDGLAGVSIGRAGIVRPYDFLRRRIDLGDFIRPLLPP